MEIDQPAPAHHRGIERRQTMFEMTWNQAKAIQDRQMAHYRRLIGRKGVKKIRQHTFCPSDLNPDELHRVSFINTLVPRGGSFEHLFTGHQPQDNDNSGYHMHMAMESGKIYH